MKSVGERAIGLLILTAGLLAPTERAALGWSFKEHIQFTRLAANRLIADPRTPVEMKAWLERAVPERFDLDAEAEFFYHARVGLEATSYPSGLLYWAYAPDVHALKDPKGTRVQPYNVHERLLHFIEIEHFLTGSQPRKYTPDLVGKPKLDEIPNEIHDPRFLQAGFLPMRIEECYTKLVASIRDGRLEGGGADDADCALRHAGYLAHYLADNTQPHHATVDYKSQSYFKNPRRAPNVHIAVEYLMCDDEKNNYPELRREYWPLFAKHLDTFVDPIQTDDLFRATLEVSLQSYDALPLIGEAAAASVVPAGAGQRVDTIDIERFFRFRGKVNGVEMSMIDLKARHTAWAVKRIERVWLRAWIEATTKK